VSPEALERITSELQRLEKEGAIFEPLMGKFSQRQPSQVEVRALGAMLHSIYTGIEGVLKRLLIELDGTVPSSQGWHSELLAQALRVTGSRFRVAGYGAGYVELFVAPLKGALDLA
jgi:hypothetical protein